MNAITLRSEKVPKVPYAIEREKKSEVKGVSGEMEVLAVIHREE